MVSPCTESFADMPGDAKTRFCKKCGEDVYDLSERTEAEAEALYRDAGVKKLCVRYAKDGRGAILFKAATLAAIVSATACSSAMPAPPPATPVEEDRDMGDGVLDTQDRCPDEPTANGEGCPDPAPPPAPDAGH